MTGLTPVSFQKPRRHEPRLSEPYVPGRRHERYWTEGEDQVLRDRYPEGGVAACQPHLPANHASPSAIYQRAVKLGLASQHKAKRELPADFDERLREAWATMDPRKKGEVRRLADQFNVPRHWITQRAMRLGLSVAHKKEPRWTAAEDELMRKVPLHDPKAASRIFHQHGFPRTPTAIVVRAKRLDLSRRATREELSARKAARILGIDDKAITALCIAGILPATKRADRRLAQQGGSAWDIRPSDLRQYVIDHIERVDIRKVDKVAFVDLLVNGGEA